MTSVLANVSFSFSPFVSEEQSLRFQARLRALPPPKFAAPAQAPATEERAETGHFSHKLLLLQCLLSRRKDVGLGSKMKGSRTVSW